MNMLIFTIVAALAWIVSFGVFRNYEVKSISLKTQVTSSPRVTVAPTQVPESFVLQTNYHVYQTFNNCGPAALSMALRHLDINISQHELGDILRPHQNSLGINDDKSVTLAELANYATKHDLIAYVRPNGSINTLTKFIALGLPVIVITRLSATDDIGHFRVVKGYDNNGRVILQDDSYQGPNLKFGYEEFERLWQDHNYMYLALVPEHKVPEAQRILGENLDSRYAWQEALNSNKAILSKNPNDIVAQFSASVAQYYLADYKSSAESFLAIEGKLSERVLWYQIEPILALEEVGMYQKVLDISDKILQGGNVAYAELYEIRARIYTKTNQKALAQDARQKMELYSKPALY